MADNGSGANSAWAVKMAASDWFRSGSAMLGGAIVIVVYATFCGVSLPHIMDPERIRHAMSALASGFVFTGLCWKFAGAPEESEIRRLVESQTKGVRAASADASRKLDKLTIRYEAHRAALSHFAGVFIAWDADSEVSASDKACRVINVPERDPMPGYMRRDTPTES